MSSAASSAPPDKSGTKNIGGQEILTLNYCNCRLPLTPNETKFIPA